MITAIILAGAVAAANCGPLVHNESGGDYLNPADRQRLAAVEAFHFTRDVETLKHGASDALGGDISYTLEHFPNHHRALIAMVQLARRDKTTQPHGARYSVTCYFDRAIRFKPTDATVRTIYGAYLLAADKPEGALEHFLEAVRLDPNNATTHYNLGLLYVKRKNYAQAKIHARQAYDLGFPLQGLKNKLIEARQWEGTK